MSEKKFEVTYSDEAKKVIGSIGNWDEVAGMSLPKDEFGAVSAMRKMAVMAVEKMDDEILKCIREVAVEQGYSNIVTLDKRVIAAKLCRLEPKEIVVHGYSPGRAVNSLSYTCPTCGAHIGRYPFCKYCGQALKIEN